MAHSGDLIEGVLMAPLESRCVHKVQLDSIVHSIFYVRKWFLRLRLNFLKFSAVSALKFLKIFLNFLDSEPHHF